MLEISKLLISSQYKINTVLIYIRKNSKMKENDLDWFTSVYVEILLSVLKVGVLVNNIRRELGREPVKWMDETERLDKKERQDASTNPKG